MSRKVWVTKYAVTEGIRECAVNEGPSDSDYVYVRWYEGWSGLGLQCRVGRDCFDTEAEARRRAAEMCRAKLKSLARAKARVESMLEHFEKVGS